MSHGTVTLIEEILKRRHQIVDESLLKKMSTYLFNFMLRDADAAEVLLAAPNRFVQKIPEVIPKEKLMQFASKHDVALVNKLIQFAQIDQAMAKEMMQANKAGPPVKNQKEKPDLMGRTHIAIQRNPVVKKQNNIHGVMLGNEFIPMIDRKTRNFKQKLCSVGSSTSREVILLDPDDQLLKNLYDDLKKKLPNNSDPLVILEEVKKLTQSCFPGKNPDGFINNYMNQGKQVIPLSAFISEKQGVCRHHTLLNAYLLSRLVEDNLLHGNVIHHRQNFSSGAHTWNVFQNDNGKVYSLDSLWNDVTCMSDNPGAINYLYGQDVETQIRKMHFANPPAHPLQNKQPVELLKNPMILKAQINLQKVAIENIAPTPDYEKKINQIKDYIEKTPFIVGDYLFWKGGLMLKLDDGNKKRVPHSVYRIYENIMQHRVDLSEPEQAKKLWQSIQLLAKTALSQSKSDRHHTTTTFYENIVADNGAFTEVASDFEHQSKSSK